jgi:hypothetical protein
MSDTDERLAYYEARYRETGDGAFARDAYAWARDTEHPPSRDIPEWVLMYFDSVVQKLSELDAHIRADITTARVRGKKSNGRNRRPKRETYFAKLPAIIQWEPWTSLNRRRDWFVAKQVAERRGATRGPRVTNKQQAIDDVATAVHISRGTVERIVKRSRQKRR